MEGIIELLISLRWIWGFSFWILFFFSKDDKLVIAVGSTSNTHGVPGLEHSFQLKVSESLL